MKITFASVRGDTCTFGPFERLVFRGIELRADAQRNPLAVHDGVYWMIRGEGYSRFEVTGPVFIDLASDGEPPSGSGPHDTLSAVDGVVSVDGRVFVVQDTKRNDWYSPKTTRHWITMAVRH